MSFRTELFKSAEFSFRDSLEMVGHSHDTGWSDSGPSLLRSPRIELSGSDTIALYLGQNFFNLVELFSEDSFEVAGHSGLILGGLTEHSLFQVS